MKLRPTFTPNASQKAVMYKILTAPTPRVAFSDINASPNTVAARDILMKLGAVSLVDGNIELTDSGMDLAKQYAIIDDDGNIIDPPQTEAYVHPTLLSQLLEMSNLRP